MRLVDADVLLTVHKHEQEQIHSDWDVEDLAAAIALAPTAKAIPIEWLEDWKRWADSDGDVELSQAIYFLFDRWQKEQEAEDE